MSSTGGILSSTGGAVVEAIVHPVFLFADPKNAPPGMNSPGWVAHAAIFGVIHLILSLVSMGLLLLTYVEFKSDKNSKKARPYLRVMLLSIIWLCATSRWIFLLIDPYALNDIFHPIIEATLFTLIFPGMNSALCLLLFTVFQMVQVAETAKKAPPGFLPATKWLFITMCIGEFGAQFASDYGRAMYPETDFPWIWICAYWYIGWGTVVGIGFGYVAFKLQQLLDDRLKQQMRRMFVCLYISCGFCFFMAFISGTKLWGDSHLWNYELVENAMRVAEVTMLVVLTLAVTSPKGLAKRITAVSSRAGSSRGSTAAGSRTSSHTSVDKKGANATEIVKLKTESAV